MQFYEIFYINKYGNMFNLMYVLEIYIMNKK